MTTETTAIVTMDNMAGGALIAGQSGPSSILPSKNELGVMMAIANNIYQTSGKLIPAEIKTAGEALAIMLAGNELGIPPMAAFREIYIVKGRTVPSYRVIAGLVLNGDPGAKLEWIERSEKRACVRLTRSNGMQIEVEYTIEMAKKSGQAASRSGEPGVWDKYPADMLAKSALTRACRLAGADLITGIGAGIPVSLARRAPANAGSGRTDSARC